MKPSQFGFIFLVLFIRIQDCRAETISPKTTNVSLKGIISSPKDVPNIPKEVSWSTAPLSGNDRIPFALYYTDDKGHRGEVGLEDRGQIWLAGKKTTQTQVSKIMKAIQNLPEGWSGSLELDKFRVIAMGPSGPEGVVEGVMHQNHDRVQVIMYDQRPYFPGQFRLFISDRFPLDDILAQMNANGQ